jgi:hypothetical protein
MTQEEQIQILCNLGVQPLHEQFMPLSESDIQVLEAELGAFPVDYRNLVTRFGGAIFDCDVQFELTDRGFLKISPEGTATLDCIYGAKYGNDPWDSNSLHANIEWMRGRIPQDMIPIAACGSDHICISLHGPDSGATFYWDREEERVYRISNSFKDFLRSLKRAD